MQRPRKVSTLIPPSQHAQLARIAKTSHTTIGEVLRWGAGLAVAVAAAQNGNMQPAFEPDHRRKGD